MKIIKFKLHCISCGKEADKLDDGHCFDCSVYFLEQNYCCGLNDPAKVFNLNPDCLRFDGCRLKEFYGCDDCAFFREDNENLINASCCGKGK